MDTWRTRPRKSCDSCDKELADEKDDAEWNRLDCPDDWRDDLCWKYYGGECQEPDWRKLKAEIARLTAKCDHWKAETIRISGKTHEWYREPEEE